jgi:hypothetical protein
MLRKEVGKVFEDECLFCEKETLHVVVEPVDNDTDLHQCTICGSTSVSGLAYEFVWEMVNNMKEIQILQYEPKKICVQVADIFLSHFEVDEMLAEDIDTLEKELIKFYNREKLGDPEIAEDFASEVLFQICYVLSQRDGVTH